MQFDEERFNEREAVAAGKSSERVLESSGSAIIDFALLAGVPGLDKERVKTEFPETGLDSRERVRFEGMFPLK